MSSTALEWALDPRKTGKLDPEDRLVLAFRAMLTQPYQGYRPATDSEVWEFSGMVPETVIACLGRLRISGLIGRMNLIDDYEYGQP